MPQNHFTSNVDIPTSIEGMDAALNRIAREGARKLLQKALEAEIEVHVNVYADLRSDNDRRSVVRNGYGPERTIYTEVRMVS